MCICAYCSLIYKFKVINYFLPEFCLKFGNQPIKCIQAPQAPKSPDAMSMLFHDKSEKIRVLFFSK